MSRLFLFVMISLPLHVLSADPISLKRGVLDLRGWNPESTPVISMNGEWRFYWQQLLLHGDEEKTRAAFIQLSIPWNEQLVEGQQLPKNGYATYALDIFLPDGIDSVSFAVPAVFNSYAFFVNDLLLCQSGKVGSSSVATVPRWEPQAVKFKTSDDTLHVIFQISNFQGTRGGCAEVMRLAAGDHLTRLKSRYTTAGILLVMVFSIVCLSCIAAYSLNGHRPLLYFGLLCLAFAIRFIFSDLYFYYDLLPNPGWSLAAKIEYMTIPLLISIGTWFLSSIYPLDFKKIMKWIFLATNGVLALVIVVSPSSVFSQMLVVVQVVALCFTLYTIYVLVKALLSKRSGAWFTMLGLAVFSLVGFYNVYAFLTILDLNRMLIYLGYGVALVLNIIALFYRTPLTLSKENDNMLRYEDLYGSDTNLSQ